MCHPVQDKCVSHTHKHTSVERWLDMVRDKPSGGQQLASMWTRAQTHPQGWWEETSCADHKDSSEYNKNALNMIAGLSGFSDCSIALAAKVFFNQYYLTEILLLLFFGGRWKSETFIRGRAFQESCKCVAQPIHQLANMFSTTCQRVPKKKYIYTHRDDRWIDR